MATYKALDQLNIPFLNESSSMVQGDAVLLSLHPHHAQKILSGEKKLEFRRAWAKRPVSLIVIYATIPVQKIVGVAKLKQVHRGSAGELWKLARLKGGGLTRQELYDYFEGREEGYAVEIESVQQFAPSLNPEELVRNFTPPQSFSYLDSRAVTKLASSMEKHRSRGHVIFVAGVHGVGKTTLCQNFALANGIMHRSASQLIRHAKESAISKNGKVVKDIGGNQKLLIDAVERIRSSGSTLLLDGHFALLNADRQPQPLTKEVFEELGIKAVIAIHDKASEIAKRLAGRDTGTLNIRQVSALQSLELTNAERICNELGIPFKKIKSLNQMAFDQVASSLASQCRP